MPLVRAEVRNEYALGAPELYREAKKEDPKEILEGVAVAGLVGVLRQLGDLAEFAAEVFHGLQEEVTITTARSHKLMGRVRRIESALSPLEKALLAQRTHLHFAYTAGSNWHARIRCEQNHFIYGDVPQAIMESYEDCRHPPCLHMLDRFDAGGPGSCLKRYSDPTFFKRASVASGEASIDKISKEKKGRKTKKRRSRARNGAMSQDASFSYSTGRLPFTERSIGGHISPSQTASTYDTTHRSDLGEQSNLDLRNGSGYIEGVFRPSYSAEPESRDSISSAVKRHENDFLDYNFLEEKTTDVYDAIEVGRQEQGGCSSSSVTWEEKRESFGPTLRESSTDGTVQDYNPNTDLESSSPNLGVETVGDKGLDTENVDQMDGQSCNGVVPEPGSGEVHLDDVESETDNFMDALNTIESECENDIDNTKKQVVEHHSKMEDKEEDRECELGRHDFEYQSSYVESNVMTSSSPINGSHSPHGHSLNSIPPGSSQATDSIDDPQAEDDLNSVPSIEKDLRASQRTADSASPGCVESIESCENDNIHAGNHVEYVSSTVEYELERRKLESQSFSPESTAEENSPLTNGSCEHSLVPTYPKSRSATDCLISEPSREDDVNSISLLKESLQSSQRTGNTSSTEQQVRRDSHENGKVDAGNYVESISSTVSSNLGDGTRKCPESDKHVPENSNGISVSFWTNGGLLGLQPSKPPDFGALNGALNALSQDPEHKDSSKLAQIESSRSIEEDPEMDDEYQENGAAFRKASWKISPADLEIDLGKFGDPLCRNKANSTGASVTAPVSFIPANSAHQESSTSSSRMFGLSNKLLSNGSNRKSLPGGTGNTNDFEPKNHQSVEFRSFSGRSKDLFSGKSPILSPSSSPPLEHMRISFQPINGFESSKLKLKFPDGKTNSGSGTDIYPSFQLVPEVSIPQYNVGSDSDADTFYRSSPSLSDNDCHSNHSESNSEQWESSESPAHKDRDLYDALRRISLTESIPENGKANQEHIHGKSDLQFPFAENGLQNSESCRSFDLQSLSTINNSFRKEPRIDTNPNDHPLPHFERQGVMPVDEKSDALPEGSYYALDLTRSASTISQPKPAPLNEDQNDIKIMQKNKLNSQKSFGNREVSQGKSTDENDFLHQIRTKSFNLRPTMIARPPVPSGPPPAIVQVNAILEKANAIRQAVASDADDDGNWSDS